MAIFINHRFLIPSFLPSKRVSKINEGEKEMKGKD